MEVIELQVGVKILLRNKDGEFLLIRRSSTKYPDVGPLWDIPGGRIDAGFPLFDNLKREVKEETQLDIIGEPHLIAAQDIFVASRKHVVRLTYTGYANGTPFLNEENTEWKWFTSDEIKRLPDLDGYVKDLIHRQMILI